MWFWQCINILQRYLQVPPPSSCTLKDVGWCLWSAIHASLRKAFASIFQQNDAKWSHLQFKSNLHESSWMTRFSYLMSCRCVELMSPSVAAPSHFPSQLVAASPLLQCETWGFKLSMEPNTSCLKQLNLGTIFPHPSQSTKKYQKDCRNRKIRSIQEAIRSHQQWLQVQ